MGFVLETHHVQRCLLQGTLVHQSNGARRHEALGLRLLAAQADHHHLAAEVGVEADVAQRADGHRRPAANGHLTGRHHLAFQAKDREMVDAFHRAALAHGGRDNGAPGERSYHPGYYAAFALDPDGNNIEAVFHGAHQRSASSVLITF